MGGRPQAGEWDVSVVLAFSAAATPIRNEVER